MVTQVENVMVGVRIHTEEQLLELLDQIVRKSGRGDRTSREAGEYWADLLTREGHPLTTRLPDENLQAWAREGLLGDLHGSRVLDIGCGNGRNTHWFAAQGASVVGVDVSEKLLEHVSETLPASATLRHLDILRDPLPERPFDLVYDSGCFHHVPPHRRATYLRRVLPLIRHGGRFGIVAFASEAEELVDDAKMLISGDNAGGSSFDLTELRHIFSPLRVTESRRMRSDQPETFGADFLNVGLFRCNGRT